MNTQKLINTMEKDTAEAVKSVSFKLLAGFVKKTPVLSGDAQNSWNITEDKIDTSLVQSVRGNISGKKDVYITNSINYILKLENGMPGGSKQAPKGMVALTINELKNL